LPVTNEPKIYIPYLQFWQSCAIGKLQILGVCLSRNEIMNTERLAGIAILIFTFFIGCSGNYGEIKPQTESESKGTQRELIDSWSDYDIWLIYKKAQLAGLIFDWKYDDRTILAESNWRKVKDQEMWQEIVKANTMSDGDFKLPGDYSGSTSRVEGIWGPDIQLYGLIVYQTYSVSLGSVKLVDENAIRLSLQPAAAVTNR